MKRYVFKDEKIILNKDKKIVKLKVKNTGDRPIQIGSHYHFYETNEALEFDRELAYGKKLNVPSGMAVRFEPGVSKEVELICFGGKGKVYGFNNAIDKELDLDRANSTLSDEVSKLSLSHEEYSKIYGITTGSSVRLGDTNLYAKVEADFATYGDECKFGGGKSLRDGMSVSAEDVECVDVVITNALIIDYTGIYKADIGIKNGKIAAIGKGGNPSISDCDFAIGTPTEAIAGEGLIITAGAIDTHVHFINPEQVKVALESGVTTLFGGGSGPAEGSKATTSTPGEFHIKMMLKASENMPINIGLYGKAGGIGEQNANQLKAGAAGLKIHEDWGAMGSVIKHSLKVAKEYDVSVGLHSDTLNEYGFADDTIKAIGDYTIHTFHTEGAGGGHAPDILKLASLPNVLPASTNPTMPFTENTIVEHLDMLMVCHHLSKDVAEDVAFADSRIRANTIGAEDVLHDMGILSIMSSDAQAMGRIGETITRTWQAAHKMKEQFGVLKENLKSEFLENNARLSELDLSNDSTYCDNNRIKRYIAKYTINPAIATGIDEYVGSIEIGKLADLVIWDPKFFGIKPKMVLKGGIVVNSIMGDSNASIPTPRPLEYKPMFGALAINLSCVNFVSDASLKNDIVKKYELKKPCLAVKGASSYKKTDLKHNDKLCEISVDAQTYEVRVDGKVVNSEPLKELPLTQKYNLF